MVVLFKGSFTQFHDVFTDSVNVLGLDVVTRGSEEYSSTTIFPFVISFVRRLSTDVVLYFFAHIRVVPNLRLYAASTPSMLNIVLFPV